MKKGFTLVEIVLVVGILSLLLGGIITAFSHFRKVFQKQEEVGEISNQAAMLLAYLRDDFANAAPPGDIPLSEINKAISCSGDNLSFPIFRDNAGNSDRVVYSHIGGNVFRRVGGEPARTIINNFVSSLTWSFTSDQEFLADIASQTPRVSLSLNLVLGKKGTDGNVAEYFKIQTKIFPVKWNRFLQTKHITSVQ